MSDFFIYNIILFRCIQSMRICNLSHLLTYILHCEYFNEFFPRGLFHPRNQNFHTAGCYGYFEVEYGPQKILFKYIFIFYLFLFLFWNLKMPSMQSLWILISFFTHDLFQLSIFFCFLGYVFSFTFEFLVLKTWLPSLRFQFLGPLGAVSF